MALLSLRPRICATLDGGCERNVGSYVRIWVANALRQLPRQPDLLRRGLPRRLEHPNAALVEFEAEFAADEFQRLFAEDLAAPARQRGDVRFLAMGGDAVEIVAGGEHLGGHTFLVGDE